MISEVILLSGDIIEITREQVEQLKQAAVQAPLKRARFCLHQSHDDKVQEMVIAFCRDSYVRPHRHIDKSESFYVIEGELMVVFFDDRGKVIRHIKMGPPGSGHTFLYRLSSNLWHTVLPLSEFVIIHETAAGPFAKEEANIAAWAPQESDAKGIKKFLARILPQSRA